MATITLSDVKYFRSGAVYLLAQIGNAWSGGAIPTTARYSFIAPSAGATSVSFSMTGWYLSAGSLIALRFFIGTDPNSHIDADSTYEYTGDLTIDSTISGSADILLLPGQTYYLWVFPANQDYGLYSCEAAVASIETSGAAGDSITDISDIVLGSPFTVTWTPATATFRNRLKFMVGDWSHTTDPIHPNTTSEYKYRYTIPLEAAEQIPDSNTGEVTVELYTYSDADATVQVGSSSDWDVMVTVPENDFTRPTVNVILDAVSPSLPDTFDGLFIQGKTKVQVNLLANGKYGATIESYSMKQATRSSNTDGHFVTDYLSTPGETTITGYAVDSRGFTGSASKDITVLAYIKPKILPADGESEVVASRCDADGNLSSSGTYLKIKAKRSYTLLTANGYQHNYCAIQFRYKLANAESYSDWVTILDSGSLGSDEVETDALLGGVLSAQSTYAVEIRVIDDIGDSNFTTIIVPTDKVYMHRTRNGMGLGKYVEGENLLDVAWDAHFRGEVLVGDTGMTLKEYILAVISEGG